jgi:hypothetical protein
MLAAKPGGQIGKVFALRGSVSAGVIIGWELTQVPQFEKTK